jgi:hypothetical protein
VFAESTEGANPRMNIDITHGENNYPLLDMVGLVVYKQLGSRWCFTATLTQDKMRKMASPLDEMCIICGYQYTENICIHLFAANGHQIDYWIHSLGFITDLVSEKHMTDGVLDLGEKQMVKVWTEIISGFGCGYGPTWHSLTSRKNLY